MFLSDVSIARPVLALMVVLALVVFGLISYSELGVDLMPDVDFPIATVTTVFPGADPETVESEVSEPIEEELATLAGIKELQSISSENVSVVMIMFELDVDFDVAVQDIRDRLSRLQRDLPDGAEVPMVERLDVNAMPVLSVAVSGEGTQQDLGRFVEDVVKPRVDSADGVGRVEIVGMREREIRVWLNSDLMASYNVNAFEVVGALQRNNVEFPSGRIETGDREYIVVTAGELEAVKEFNDIVIASRNGTFIRLRDVAEVEDGLADLRNLARLNGEPAIGLRVLKESGANTIAVSDAVHEEIDILRRELPPGINISIPSDTSFYIRDSVEDTLHHIFIGGIFAILIVLLFLGNFRTTLIAAVTIPTSIIATFIFMRALGFTLNIMTLLAIALSVGMLIDDAIVVLENIFRHASSGKTPMTAAKTGTNEIAFAVLAITLSIIAVFVPVAFMHGMIGRIMYQYGITVVVAVSASYFVAFTLTPMLASRFISSEKSGFFLFVWFDAGFAKLESGYRWLIAAALRRKVLTVFIAFIAFVAALGVYPLMETELKTSSDDSRLQMNLEMPTGTPIARLLEETRGIEDILLATPEVENIFTTLGAGRRKEQHKGQIYIDLVDKTERERGKFEILDDLRERMTLLPGVKIIIGEVADMEAMGNYNFEFELTGNDFDELARVADQFVSTLSQTPGFRDVGQTFESGKPEVRLEIDRDRAADLGVDALTLGSTLNLLVSGEQPVTTFEEGGEQYDVRLRLEESFRDRPEDLLSLEVPGSRGERRELAGFVTIHTAEGPSEIRHSHGLRMIEVHTNLEIPLGSATKITDQLFDELLPSGVNARVTGMALHMQESFESMGFALVLAILLVYMILAAQYNHFVHPLTIMISLPLAFVGAFGLLFICNMTVNIFSLIGLIMLMGLVTKNAVLVVDLTNQYRAQGMERDEALMEAGPIRLRPVLMTTFAMIGGMLPVALMLGGGAGSEMRAPMAVVVIGGLITSTLLTLIVVPVVYALFDIATDWFVKRVLRIK